MQYYSSRISKNISKTPEGYLVCHGVPIARTGTQDYLGQELGLSNKYDQWVKAYRTEDEVFSDETLASFEGKPFTDDHPPVPLDVNNIQQYQRGHIQNVRRSKEEPDLLVADIIITDNKVISEVESGLKREISSGYDSFYEPFQDGYKQTSIRGNHVALVDKGRAGPRVRIKDSETKKEYSMSKKSRILAAMFKSYAKDASPEELAEAMECVGEKTTDAEEEKTLIEKIKDVFTKGEAEPAPVQEDEDPMAGAAERIAALEEKVAALMAAESSEGHDLTSDEDPEEVTDEDPEDEDEEKEMTTDSVIHTLRHLQSSVGSIKDLAQRKKVSDALAVSMKAIKAKDSAKNGYGIIAKAKTVVKDSAAKDHADLGKTWAAKFNPHYKGEK